MIDGRFEIEEEAGHGGMGVVYRAVDVQNGERVAIKVLKRGDSADLARFEREARALALLDHPGIVGYHSHGVTTTGEPYLVMEWLQGIDVARYLTHSRVGAADALRLVARAAEALGVAHARGMVHRDVKPQNLFLCDGRLDRVKVLDFGIARMHAVTALTAANAIVGTLGYMAPEQARGASVDARCDVFGLGCVLYECLVGAPAFEGEQPVAILAKILMSDPQRPSERCPGIAPELDAFVLRMLAKRPDERPADGAAVCAEADALAERTVSLVPEPTARAVAYDVATGVALGITHSERRTVSVILTAPERLELADTLPHAALESDEIVRAGARFGARVEQLADGTVVALLVGVGEPTDLAARAARCALAISAHHKRASLSLVTGRALLGATLPVGDLIDRAVQQLVAHSEPSLRIDELTAGLLDGRFDIGGDEHGLRLCGMREDAEPIRTLLGRPTPCVGRERETALLCALFDECISEPIARAALLVASAGAGKSRLIHEVLSSIAPRGSAVEVWTGRGDPMTVGSPFGMLSRALRRAFGLHDGAPLALQQQKTRARVARHVAKQDDAQRIAELAGEMIGVPFSDEERPELRNARNDALALGDQMRAAFIELLEAECTAAPLVLVLEDAHWGDAPSFAFVDAALRTLRHRPFFVVATARPEIHRAFPGLWQDRGVQEVRVSALTRRAGERLVREMLGFEIDAATVARLVDDAEGNPLFLEELIRAQSEGRKGAPSTVLAMLSARLEALDSSERLLLRAGSVYGERFWRGGVCDVLGFGAQVEQIDEILDRLVEREWIVRQAQSRVAGESEYAFRHALFRDAAYAILTDGDRRLAHGIAGGWLERAGASDPMALAEHYERGGPPGKALMWYRRAAEQALEGNDFGAAIERAERGVAHGAAAEVLGALRLVQAIAHDWRGENSEAAARAREALALIPRTSPSWYHAASEVAVMSRRLGDRDALAFVAAALDEVPDETFAESAELRAIGRIIVQLTLGGFPNDATKLLARVDALPDEKLASDPAARAWVSSGRAAVATIIHNDLRPFFELAEEIRNDGDRGGDLRTMCNVRIYAGIGLCAMGDIGRAESMLREGLTIALDNGFSSMATTVRIRLGALLVESGRPEEALSMGELGLEAARAQRDLFYEALADDLIAQALTVMGRLEKAERHARRAVELAGPIPVVRSHINATLASVLLEQHKPELALEVALAARTHQSSPQANASDEARVRLVHAKALDAYGRREDARTAIREARDRVLARAQSLGDLGAIFLSGRPECAQTIELAHEWNV